MEPPSAFSYLCPTHVYDAHPILHLTATSREPVSIAATMDPVYTDKSEWRPVPFVTWSTERTFSAEIVDLTDTELIALGFLGPSEPLITHAHLSFIIARTPSRRRLGLRQAEVRQTVTYSVQKVDVPTGS